MTWFDATRERHKSGPIEPGVLRSLQTRLRARLASRLTAQDCQALASSTPEQIAHTLSERAYGQEARALGAEQTGASLVRAMIGARLTAEMLSLRAICAACPALLPWITGFTWKYDLARIRAALRARHARADIPEGGLAPLTNIPLEAYQRLARCSTPEEATLALKPFQDSPFKSALARALSPNPPALDEIEVALVHDYCRECLEPMITASRDCPPAQELLSIPI
ncbi:MAG TPA: V-type ATPase subunit, partial [Candidatus Brocadiia bacterium]|nr:V-type ATPase subunit [Candidatus Brocadiia bacterium]